MEIENKNIEKIGLFAAVKGACLGTQIFAKLRYTGLFRSLWHLFLMSGICALLIIVIGKKNLETEIKPQIDILNEYSGGFDNRKDGIYPKKNADKNFNFLLNDNIKVVYEPTFKELDFRDILDNGITWFWIPQGVFAVAKFKDRAEGSVVFLDFSTLQKYKSPNLGVFKSNKELDIYMNKELAKVVPCDFSQLPVVDTDYIENAYLSMQFISLWIQYFWQLLITSIIFAIFYAITGVGRISNMNFKSFFVVSIYAGFPAMLVSVLFEAFKLPLIGYHTVFSFGWLVYLLFILNSFIRNQEEN
jgi:hypothetical protein